MKWFPRVGTLDDVIDWPPHPSPRLCWWHVCSLQLRHQTSHLYDDTCDDVIKSHSHGVAHLIQWPLLLPTAIDVLYAERRSMATFLSPITSRRCVFCGSQGIAKGNYCGSQWVKLVRFWSLTFRLAIVYWYQTKVGCCKYCIHGNLDLIILKPPISVVLIYPRSVIFTLEGVLFSVFHDSTTSITVKTFFIIYYEDLSFSRVSFYCMFQMKK